MGDLIVMNGASELERLRDFEKHVRVRMENNQPTIDELERQFISNELKILAGPKFGQPLTAKGRRQRLSKLIAAHKRDWELFQEARAIRKRIEQVQDEEREEREKARVSEYEGDDDGWGA